LQSDSAARRDQQCLGPIEYPFDHRQCPYLRILGTCKSWISASRVRARAVHVGFIGAGRIPAAVRLRQ
jgi:hypothetical protein